MIHVLQFLNGYAIVLVWGLVAFLALLLMWQRHSRKRWWAVWSATVSVSFTGLVFLRTADSTVIAAVPANSDEGSGMILTRDSLEWNSADSIEKAIQASDGKPTLVEFYTDFGFG